MVVSPLLFLLTRAARSHYHANARALNNSLNSAQAFEEEEKAPGTTLTSS
jgi:hypothetical protein